MIAGPVPRWEKIVVALIIFCVIGYIWTLQ
jgi:hypothetical protein